MKEVKGLTLAIGSASRSVVGAVTITLQRDIRAAGGVMSIKAPPATFADLGNLLFAPATLADENGLLFTGYVEKARAILRAQAGDAENLMTLECRGAPGILDDCSVPGELVDTPAMMSGKTIHEIARFVCKKFGVKLRAEKGGGEAFLETEVEARGTQSAMDYLRGLAALRRVLFFDDASGNLVAEDSSKIAGRSPSAILSAADDCVSATATLDYADRFASVEVRAEGAAADDAEGVRAVSDDDAVKRVSPLRLRRLIAKNRITPQECSALADWEVARRAGESAELQMDLNRGLWFEPGEIVEVDAPLLGFRRAAIVLRSGLTADGDKGIRGDVLLSPPGAIVQRPHFRERAAQTGDKQPFTWKL